MNVEQANLRSGIEYTAEKHQAAGYGFLSDFLGSERDSGEVGIVGSIDEDIVDASHAQEQGDQCDGGEFVLGKELLGSNKAAGDSQQDHEGAKDGGPPADQQRGLVLRKVSQRRRVRVDGHGGLFAAKGPRPSTSAEGSTSEEGGKKRFLLVVEAMSRKSSVVGSGGVVAMAASRWATGARSFCAASLPGHEAAALRLQAGTLCWRAGFGGVAA